MTHKYIISIILLCLLPWSCMAQNEISTSLFTGQMSYTIPVYTIDDPDFHLDIALRYCSEGFKPFQPSGSYGQDWTLVAGGSITRSAQGIADEQKIKYVGGSKEPDWQVGMLQAMRDGENPTKDSVFDFSTFLYKPECGIQYYHEDFIRTYCQWDRDYMPDIYYFSFCGYKGRFTINNIGEPVIISGDFIHIDLSEFREISENNSHNSFYIPTDSSFITIHTTDGYSYVFGGSHNALEYTTSVTKNNTVDQYLPAISAWHLTKITAPNGRYITFTYVNTPQYYHDSRCLSVGLHSFITDYDWTEQNQNSDSTHIVYSLHKECLLQSINTSDATPLSVYFCSNHESSKKYDNGDFIYSVPHLQLDSIIVVYDNDTLKTAELSYQYKSSRMQLGAYPNYNWRYLRQVAVSGIGIYTMTYNDIDPNPGNSFQPISHYPNLNPANDTQYKDMVDRMGFWKTTSLQGLLNEVSLPTGGKIKFTYNNHQYGKTRRFLVAGNQDVLMNIKPDTNQLIGGTRIEKIETFSGTDALAETKTFSYKQQGTSTSSGIFYNIYEIFYPSNTNEGHPIVNPNNYGMIDSHIGYSYVEQETTIGTEKYKTAFTFDTGIGYYGSLENNYINRNTNIDDYNDTAEVCSGSLTHSEKLKLTGKLLAIEQYKGNALAKSTLYEYNDIQNQSQGMLPNNEQSLGCTDTIVILSKYSGHVARKLFVYPDVLEKSVTYEYEGNNTQPIITDKTYTHDNKLRTKRETMPDSKGVLHFTKYTYPDEIPVSFPYPLFQLCRINRIGHPIETVSGFIKDSMEYVTAGMIEEYDNINYISHGGHHYAPYLSHTYSLALSEPVTNYVPMNISGNAVLFDRRYKLDYDYIFDLQNRLISIQPSGKMAATYTWNGIYPATKTIGNLTWIYTYKPYVGITSVTDPRGITTYYSYDSAGRLIEEYQIINGGKQILNAYHYHNKTE